jgi:non-ribosomal peptide synthetase component E (peptide arylation enzyme)
VGGGGLAEVVTAALGECPPGLEVRVVETMPMTPTGKISKAQLLKRAESA